MRVTTAFNMLLALPGVNVTAVEFADDRVLVDVRLRRRRLACPHCQFTTATRHNLQRAALEEALDVLDGVPAADVDGAVRLRIERGLHLLLRRIRPYLDELDKQD